MPFGKPQRHKRGNLWLSNKGPYRASAVQVFDLHEKEENGEENLGEQEDCQGKIQKQKQNLKATSIMWNKALLSWACLFHNQLS